MTRIMLVLAMLAALAVPALAEQFEIVQGNDFGGYSKRWSYDENDADFVHGTVQMVHYYDAKERLREKQAWSTAAKMLATGIIKIDGLYDRKERLTSVTEFYSPEYAAQHGVAREETTFDSREVLKSRVTYYTPEAAAKGGCARKVEKLDAKGQTLSSACVPPGKSK